ncbi:MAG: helix-turn-helix domain-containing protein [Pseudomonadota bacterium]
MPTPHRIVILAFEQANLLDITGPAQIFTSANKTDITPHQLYDVIIGSELGGLVTTSSGVAIQTQPLSDFEKHPIHTLLVAGGTVTTESELKSLAKWIQCRSSTTKRIGSICTGAFVTAGCGLLDQRRAVTHWNHFEQFKQQFPEVKAEADPIYIKDGHVWSSAGVTAGIDLAIAMVQEDFGRDIALHTARDNVVFMKRPGGQNQFSKMLEAQTQDSGGKFDDLHQWINNNLNRPLSVIEMAEVMKMSPRNFSRSYRKIMGITPAKSVEQCRIEKARQLLESSKRSLSQISTDCGFGNEETMRRVFVRQLGVTAKEYRGRF